MSDRITLASPDDARNFAPGDEYEYVREYARGGARRRPWFTIRRRVVAAVLRLTRWWRPRIVCSAVDVQRGVITMERERWSWRRWRWERDA